ncbi:MAG: response regulator transcription factor [Ruminiclostridium sp.]|nr:response regulator transcription factor [Ruminiclostridium sp.]
MPITPGPQVMEMIRSEPESAQVPIIFLTGNSDRQSVMKVMAMKPQGYLLKTMDKYQIMDSIDTFFETQKWKNAQV